MNIAHLLVKTIDLTSETWYELANAWCPWPSYGALQNRKTNAALADISHMRHFGLGLVARVWGRSQTATRVPKQSRPCEHCSAKLRTPFCDLVRSWRQCAEVVRGAATNNHTAHARQTLIWNARSYTIETTVASTATTTHSRGHSHIQIQPRLRPQHHL